MKRTYAENWTEYKKFGRYELFAIGAVFVIPLLLLSTLYFFNASWPVIIGAVVPFFAAAYFHYCRYIWPCPRCGEPFAGKFGIGGVRDECQSCALPKWANDDEVQNPTVEDSEMRKTQ